MKKMMMLTTTAYMSERFNRDNILILERMGYEVHVVANFDKGNPSTKEVLDSFRQWVEEHHGQCYSIAITAHPSDQKSFWKAYHQCMNLIEKNHYEFIHCHTPVGGVLGRLLGHKAHIKVMYTAHGFHFFDGAPLKNWLLFYPVEKFLSKWTDVLVTINHEDYQRAKDKFHAKKTVYIPGVGVDFTKFNSDRINRNAKRLEMGWKPDDKIIISVGELSVRKNHEVIIRAIAELHDDSIKCVICGTGVLEDQLKNLVAELKLENQVQLLGYRTDISELCQAADVFALPSLQEGLSIALMEAIACKVPVVCSRIRGDVDLVTDTNYMFDPKSVKETGKALKYALESDNAKVVAENYERLKVCDITNIDRMMVDDYTLLGKSGGGAAHHRSSELS